MAEPMALLYVLGIVVATIVGWLIVRRRPPRMPHPRLDPVLHVARRRALVAVLFAVLVFIAGAVAGIALPDMLGLPFAVAPLVAGAAGLLLYSATPPRAVEVASDAPRAASLVPRSALSVVPRRWCWAFIEVSVVFVALVAFCGITASMDERGMSRVIRFDSGAYSSIASPYPGWFYGVPALIGFAVLVAAIAVALHRISATPAFPLAEDAELDRTWRRSSVEVVLKLASGAVLFATGGVSAMAGLTIGNATIDGETPVVWEVISDGLLIGGGVALIMSIISVTLAGLTAATMSGRVVAAGERVTA